MGYSKTDPAITAYSTKKVDIVELLDSLTDQQRKAIGEVIREARVEGSYGCSSEREESFWIEDTTTTLNCLADCFDKYDPESVLDWRI